MGMVKREMERKESAWAHVAREKNYRCSVCSSLIIYDERDVYFDTKMCGSCNAGWQSMKDE